MNGGRVAAVGPALSALVSLAGCGFTDDYFIDRGSGGANTLSTGGGAGDGSKSTQGGSGGRSASGGSSGSSWGGSGGAASGGAANGGGETAGAGGGAACDAANCATTCCGDVCVDTLTDVEHCGACDASCPAGRDCSAGACDGGWTTMAAPPMMFAARTRPGFTIFDGKLFIFGGTDGGGKALNTGAIYDPQSDSWSLVSVGAATPSPRELSTVVVVGSQLFVFGGRNGITYLQSGALYDPATDTWSAVGNSSSPRAAAAVGGIGSELFVWGGLTSGGGPGSSPERYDSNDDSWRPAAAQAGPNALFGSTWAFSADSFFVYGGLDANVRQDLTYRYDLAGDAWQALPRGPSARSFALAAFDGAAFYVWGGRDATNVRDDGSVFTDQWTPMSRVGAPSPRCAAPRQGGWAFALGPGDVVFLGGQDVAANLLTDGGRYQAATGWSAIPSWPSGHDHDYGVGAFTGKEILIWGGASGPMPTKLGERWAP